MPNQIEERDPEIIEAEVAAEQPQSRLRWIVIALAVVAVAVAGALYSYYSVRESTDDAQVDGHVHPIAARVGGTVARVAIENNQYVEAGAVLAEIDPRDYQTALARAEADMAEQEALWRASEADIPVTSEMTASRVSDTEAGVAEARASLLAAQKESEAAQARLNAAQARVREVAANSQKASKDLDRMKQLIAKEEISQQQYDAAVASADSLQAAQQAAQAAVSDAEADIQTAQSHIAREQARLAQAQAAVQAAQTAPQQVAAIRARAESARAKYDRAKADLDQAKLNLAYATIKAPISGVVSKKNIEVGQTVQTGQPVLAIVPLHDVWVTANFKETQLRYMRPGQKAVVSVDAYGAKKYNGHIESIAAATGARFSLLPPENATGNYVKVIQRVPVKILLDDPPDPEHPLRPGMSVYPTVFTR
jgi:membrane fusion protein, multidrug efflux system